MDIRIMRNNGESVLTLSGRLDTVTAPQLQETLIPEFENNGQITLDFAELSYISSAGLRVLLLAEKTAKSKRVPMRLVGIAPEIMTILEMTGFAEILTIL